MVNSKKMSKSSIAVIVLAILLVLSMVAGLTGAWFNNSASGKSNSGALGFGKVSVSATNGTLTYHGLDTVSKVVDNDTWTAGATTVANASDVRIFYKVVYSVDLYTDADGTILVTDGTERGYWTGLTQAKTTYGYLKANDATVGAAAGASGEIKFDSNNVWNGNANIRYLYAKVQIVAYQAANMVKTDVVKLLGCSDSQADALIVLRDSSTQASGTVAP